MTEVVINQNDGFVSITASGGEVNLDFDFPIYEKAHLRIIRTRDGVDTDLVLDTDYTIATDQLELTAGGRAVLSVAATAADVYALLLNAPEARTTDFNNAGDFFASTLNRELDLEMQAIQQLRRDIDKSARLPDSSTLASLTLPTPEADKIIGWNLAGDGLTNYTPNTSAYLSVTAAAETVLDDTTVAEMVDTLGGASSTGTGGLARATSPTFVTPILGTPTSVTLTNATGLPEAGLTLADNTTNDASTSKHGFLKKLSNVSTEFMNGQGNWSTPSSAASTTSTASSSASITFGSLDFTANVGYQLFANNVLPASDGVNLEIRVTDDGSTYDLPTSLAAMQLDGGGPGAEYTAVATLSQGNAAGEHAELIATITQPLTTGKVFMAFNAHFKNTAGTEIGRNGQAYWNYTAIVTGIRAICSSGNISTGTFTLKPIPR